MIFISFFRFFSFRWLLFSFNFWIVNHENYTLVMKQKKSHFTANKLVRRKMACTCRVCVRVCSIYFRQCLFVLQCNTNVDSTNPRMTSIPWHKNLLNGRFIVCACESSLSIVSFKLIWSETNRMRIIAKKYYDFEIHCFGSKAINKFWKIVFDVRFEIFLKWHCQIVSMEEKTGERTQN